MSPPRRRSARLASATPKPKATPGLLSLPERDEVGEREPPRNHNALPVSPLPAPSTPASSALKPPRSEMHPSKFHATMAEPSSALRLGFTDIKPNRRSGNPHLAALESTPSKIGGVHSATFDFSVARDSAVTGLSSEAQQIMLELREQAAKIKADLVAQREAEGGNMFDRPFAIPKGKFSRFSAAHMAEFKKMDSIENHASAWRAQNGRFTPVKASLKRSPSKANLDGTPTSVRRTPQASPSKFEAGNHTPQPAKTGLKRTLSIANLDSPQKPSPAKRVDRSTTARKIAVPAASRQPIPSAKRLKKREEDDASTSRPKPLTDGSITSIKPDTNAPKSLSQSQSTLARLLSPTKASLAASASKGKPTISLAGTPSKATNLGGLATSATAQSLASPSRTADFKRRIISPGRFQKVKSILRGGKSNAENTFTAIPQPTAAPQTSQTPGPVRTNKELPPVPFTTPRRKLSKHVAFTPETKRAALTQDSPSPRKGGIFRGLSGLVSRSPAARSVSQPQYAGLDSVLAVSKTGDVVYPDLSALERLIEPQAEGGRNRVASVPGKFTFRSDHTIQFATASPSGFGASPGQASVRHVHESATPATDMPGSFPGPSSPSTHPNKENKAPAAMNTLKISPSKMLTGAPHGMPNKKRHRASSDEEDAQKEAAERAAKKQKNQHVPEGQALLAPRLISATPKGASKTGRPGRLGGQTPGRPQARTPARGPSSMSPAKSGTGLSVSRLNMLSRPKTRT